MTKADKTLLYLYDEHHTLVDTKEYPETENFFEAFNKAVEAGKEWLAGNPARNIQIRSGPNIT